MLIKSIKIMPILISLFIPRIKTMIYYEKALLIVEEKDEYIL